METSSVQNSDEKKETASNVITVSVVANRSNSGSDISTFGKNTSLSEIQNAASVRSSPGSNTVTKIFRTSNEWKSQNTVSIKQSDRTDVCFKADYLQQLSTNALPPYAPKSPPPFSSDSVPFETHSCSACGDTFALKSSLMFHLERRSVLIKFRCEACIGVRIFYNRCVLLSHIRAHKDQGEKSEIKNAVVGVLPRVFMDGIQSEFVNNLDDELSAIDDNDVTPASDLLEFSLKEIDVAENSEDKKDFACMKVKCVDCNEEFDSIKGRKDHYTNGDKIPLVISQCNTCGMVCPSKCSLKAHQRIHLQISPYVCPECGDSPDPHWANFQHHVNYKCFHNTRSVGYKCPVCKRVSPSHDSLLKHMELHTEKYAKCDSCPRAYLSSSAFQTHVKEHHDVDSVNQHIIYKCSLCDIVFLTHDQMLAHRSSHLKEQICEYVFNCLQCGKTLENKDLLFDHIKTTHPKIFKTVVKQEPQTNKPAVSIQVHYRGMVECIICNCTFHSHQGYSVHVARAHVNLNQPCTYCFMVLSNRKEMIKHGKKHLQRGSILCLLCNNKNCTDGKSLDLHLTRHVQKLKFCTFCPICDQIMRNPPEAMKHLRGEHFMVTKIEPGIKSDQSPSKLGKVSCHFCRNAFGNDNDLQEHLKKEHNVDSSQNNSKSSTKETNVQVSKKSRTEVNTCIKCQYHSADRTEFRKHILTHQRIKNSYQCQECGECYKVYPSLCKHLIIAHKIKDTKKYVDEEGTNYSSDPEYPTEVSSRNAHECSVCFTAFPNESALKTHMRSHGMAFIQAKKGGPL